MQARTPMEMIKREYPEDYVAMKKVEHFIDYYLDHLSMKKMGINVNAVDMRYSNFKVIEYIERTMKAWQSN